jgi:hypothetical protein
VEDSAYDGGGILGDTEGDVVCGEVVCPLLKLFTSTATSSKIGTFVALLLGVRDATNPGIQPATNLARGKPARWVALEIEAPVESTKVTENHRVHCVGTGVKTPRSRHVHAHDNVHARRDEGVVV